MSIVLQWLGLSVKHALWSRGGEDRRRFCSRRWQRQVIFSLVRG